MEMVNLVDDPAQVEQRAELSRLLQERVAAAQRQPENLRRVP